MDISIELSEASQAMLAALRQAEGFELGKHPQIQQARDDVGGKIISGIKTYAVSKFQNPSGKLAGSFDQLVTSDTNEIGTDLPYGRRREFGFSGRTDARGRFYQDDPGQIYMMDAITDVYPYMQTRFSRAVKLAFNDVFGSEGS
jgi:phage gpG-like protein